MRCVRWVSGMIVAAATIFVVASAGAQERAVGTVTGTVTDAGTKAPVPDVTVLVVGTTRAGRTNSAGAYRIVNVPVGAMQLRATRLGYAALVQSATVTDGGTANVDFLLNTTSVTLSQVVITGTATQNEEARANGASIGVIAVDSVPQGPVLDFSDLLNSRNPGLTILQNSGAVGTGSRIEIRGVSSTGVNAGAGPQTALNTQPVIIVDGVRAYNDLRGISEIGGVGGQLVSRFDDLDHEDIEDVQVLKGPAAAALYGTEAANGVIVIQTRHGQAASAPQWHLFGVLGSNTDVATYPANYARPLGQILGGIPNTQANSCSLENEFEGVCTGKTGALEKTPSTNYNLVTNSPTIFPGYEEGAGASINGGSPTVTYFFGANWDRQQGVYHNNQDRWTHLNVGLGVHPYEQLDLGISAQYTQRRTILPFNDNVYGGILTDELLGGAAKGAYAANLGPEVMEQINTNSNVDRFTLGTNGTLRILPWLSAVGNVGVDYISQYDNAYFSQQLVPQLFPVGFANAANNSIFVYTGSASLNGKFKPFESLQSTTTFGGEWVDQSLRQVYGQGQGLVPGTGSLGGATSQFTAAEINQDVVDIGGFLQEQLAWRNVLFATISGRLDGNSAFGTGKSTTLYPAGNLSYNMSDEHYWPKNGIVTTLRFRAAAGQSGREPIFRQAQGSFIGASFNEVLGGNQSGIVPNTYGNANLKPERTSEYETGLDIGLFKERFTLTVTGYDKLTTDLVQAVPVDISTGVGPAPPASLVYTNLGKVDNRGLEIGLTGTVFKVSDLLTFDMNTSFAMNRNKLVNSGSANEITIAAGNTGIPLQEDVKGYPIGGFWASRFTYTAGPNGVVTPSSIHYANNGVPTYIGEGGPRDELSFNPIVTLFRYLRVNALFDRRDGITIYDATDDFRCLGGFQMGQDCNDPHAPAQHQAAAVALNGPGYGIGRSEYGYLLNGSFWKFRELTFQLTAPESWSRMLHGHSASISLSGRNLATWTGYRGLDPEINSAGPNYVANFQFFAQPPTRVWVGRLDFTW